MFEIINNLIQCNAYYFQFISHKKKKKKENVEKYKIKEQ